MRKEKENKLKGPEIGGFITGIVGVFLFIPIGLGVSTRAIRECLYQRFVAEMTVDISNLNRVMSKIAGLPANIEPQIMLKNIEQKLKIAEGVSCAGAVLLILGGVAAIAGAIFGPHKKTLAATISIVVSGIMLIYGGSLAIGAASLFSKMQDFLPTTYINFSAISDDVAKQIFLEQFHSNSNQVMIGSSIVAGVLGVMGIAAVISAVVIFCNTK